MDNLEQAKKSLWRARDADSTTEKEQHLAAGIEFLAKAIDEHSAPTDPS